MARRAHPVRWHAESERTLQVEQQLGDVSGKDPDAILSEALDLALLWANPSIGAAPHRVIETQDEAVAQKVLQSLGFRTDVDTDLEQARVNAGP